MRCRPALPVRDVRAWLARRRSLGAPNPFPGVQGASAVHQKMIELFQREQQKANEDLAELHARVEHPALDAVEAKVAKLHDREYRAPSRDVPCADERSECLRCLQANGDAPLSCADKVAALDKCAQAVSKVHLRSSTE